MVGLMSVIPFSPSRLTPLLSAILISLSALAAAGCQPPDQPPSIAATVSPASAPAEAKAEVKKPDAPPQRDLSHDESRGGHTLSRHVGKSDADLRDRLRREKQISAASTYADRETAERAVGAALVAGADALATWQARKGRRPNLVLHHVDRGPQPIGRSLLRGRPTPVDCHRALVVLRWDERANSFYVLTSYPEAER